MRENVLDFLELGIKFEKCPKYTSKSKAIEFEGNQQFVIIYYFKNYICEGQCYINFLCELISISTLLNSEVGITSTFIFINWQIFINFLQQICDTIFARSVRKNQ